MRSAIDRGITIIHSSYEYGVCWMMHQVLKEHLDRHNLLHVIKASVLAIGNNDRSSHAGFNGEWLE